MPVPPVMARTLFLVSKNGPSTVTWPPGRNVVHVHSQEAPAAIRMHWPWSRPACAVSAASNTGLWNVRRSPVVSPFLARVDDGVRAGVLDHVDRDRRADLRAVPPNATAWMTRPAPIPAASTAINLSRMTPSLVRWTADGIKALRYHHRS